MTYRIAVTRRARLDLNECFASFSEYSESFAAEQTARLDYVFRDLLSHSPRTWNFFFITGAPYRAYLFRVRRRTSYWIVYRIDEDVRRVDVLRFWNTSRDTRTFKI
jgi:hypothetical protein